jgi:hypothetical protein
LLITITKSWQANPPSSPLLSHRLAPSVGHTQHVPTKSAPLEDWKVLTLEDRLILASRVVIESIKNNNRPSRPPDDNVETNQKVAQNDPVETSTGDLRRSSGPFASYERTPE